MTKPSLSIPSNLIRKITPQETNALFCPASTISDLVKVGVLPFYYDAEDQAIKVAIVKPRFINARGKDRNRQLPYTLCRETIQQHDPNTHLTTDIADSGARRKHSIAEKPFQAAIHGAYEEIGITLEDIDTIYDVGCFNHKNPKKTIPKNVHVNYFLFHVNGECGHKEPSAKCIDANGTDGKVATQKAGDSINVQWLKVEDIQLKTFAETYIQDVIALSEIADRIHSQQITSHMAR